MEGSLSKWTNLMKGWQYRWFVLDDCAGALSYYLSREQMLRGKRRGCISLKKAVIGIDDEDGTTFTITSVMKTYHCQAKNSLERDGWVRSLEDTILRHAYGSRRQKNIDINEITQPQPTIEEFNKKLAEADAYLQLVIDQTQQINSKLDSLVEFDDQARCSLITTYSNNMLEEAKHTIVSLQIAKHMMAPENMRLPKLDNSISKPVQQNEILVLPGITSSKTNLPESQTLFKAAYSTSDEDFFDAVDVEANNEFRDTNTYSSPEDDGSSSKSYSTTDENEVTEDIKATGVLRKSYPSADSMPDFSSDFQEKNETENNGDTHSVGNMERNELEIHDREYSYVRTSSSIGENAVRVNAMAERDEIRCCGQNVSQLSCDSQEENECEADRGTCKIVDPEEKDTELATLDHSRPGSSTGRNEEPIISSKPSSHHTYQREDGSLNYDYFYESRDESSVKIECSVVTHLLSQVKIGMDLSKVVLPTFILEKRSLLEMYADFFAHPDLFLAIADQPEARQRMVQLVKWYITAFEAGRKTSLPKKPYNPILGEIFQCYWNIPGEASEGESLEGGPVPWCRSNNLAFVAEQVSHHPPVSAFYAECPNKGISCTAFVWTKSKFLGLSIGVANEGKALVNLINHDEQYSLTFPSGYGRSILTKPWFELGGNINIFCEKTGYLAKIEFLTKPFYGSKKHRVVGEIFEPDSKKPFLTIGGEWCGTIRARSSEGEEEVFADVKNMTVLEKTVRPVDEQECYESRQVWKEVTAGLWLNDISRATNAKIEVENRQRKEEQTRKENGIEWETRLFETEATGNWIYRAPLENRIAAIKKISPALQ